MLSDTAVAAKDPLMVNSTVAAGAKATRPCTKKPLSVEAPKNQRTKVINSTVAAGAEATRPSTTFVS